MQIQVMGMQEVILEASSQECKHQALVAQTLSLEHTAQDTLAVLEFQVLVL
jgi:hypothetical protein